MGSSLETLERSLRLRDQRRVESAAFVVIWVGAGGGILASAIRSSDSLPMIGATILGGAVAIIGGMMLVSRLSRWWARRRVERLLSSLVEGPSLASYLELLGREDSPRAVEVEVEPVRSAASDRAIAARFPGASVTREGARLRVRSAACECRHTDSVEDEGLVTSYDNGPLHELFMGVIACTGPDVRVRVREIPATSASGASTRRPRRRR